MCIYVCECIYNSYAFIILKTNELSYIRMYECMYEHTYHYYLLSKVIFKYERKLIRRC